jgi:hypothetical protein
MTAAADLDPYLLPLPTPGSPVVLPHLATSLHAHLNGRYADPVWPLAPLTENPSQSKKTIRWALWPAPLRDEMRLAAWNLINGQLRPTFLQGHSSGMRSRLSLSDTYSTAASGSSSRDGSQEEESALSPSAAPASCTTTAGTSATPAAAGARS